jgi:hypothetical protein
VGINLKIKIKKKPNPIKLMITELSLYSNLYKTRNVPIKQILPLIRGKRYKNESSMDIDVVIKYILNKVNSEIHDEN